LFDVKTMTVGWQFSGAVVHCAVMTCHST